MRSADPICFSNALSRHVFASHRQEPQLLLTPSFDCRWCKQFAPSFTALLISLSVTALQTHTYIQISIDNSLINFNANSSSNENYYQQRFVNIFIFYCPSIFSMPCRSNRVLLHLRLQIILQADFID